MFILMYLGRSQHIGYSYSYAKFKKRELQEIVRYILAKTLNEIQF